MSGENPSEDDWDTGDPAGDAPAGTEAPDSYIVDDTPTYPPGSFEKSLGYIDRSGQALGVLWFDLRWWRQLGNHIEASISTPGGRPDDAARSRQSAWRAESLAFCLSEHAALLALSPQLKAAEEQAERERKEREEQARIAAEKERLDALVKIGDGAVGPIRVGEPVPTEIEGMTLTRKNDSVGIKIEGKDVGRIDLSGPEGEVYGILITGGPFETWEGIQIGSTVAEWAAQIPGHFMYFVHADEFRLLVTYKTSGCSFQFTLDHDAFQDDLEDWSHLMDGDYIRLDQKYFDPNAKLRAAWVSCDWSW